MPIPSRPSFSDDSRIMIRKPLPKSALLRDYLLDEMSSCSSNGFRSYPRRQCCTTVARFLGETDLNRNPKRNRRSDFKPKQSSMLQKASVLMINAFRYLPFAGAGISRKASGFPRSLSRKLMKHGFWRKTNCQNNEEVKRLTSFADLLNEKEITPPPSPLSKVSTAVTAASTTELISVTSDGNSWSGSEFTATTNESFTTGNFSDVSLGQNDVAEELPEDKKTTNGNGVGTTTATTAVTSDSDTTENAKKWQEKYAEQFSPVSVMDFPNDNDNNNEDDDNEDEVSSVSKHKHLNVKGTKTSKHKTRVSERAHQLEPVKLQDRIAQFALENTQEENQIEKKAMALLQLLKSTVSSRHSLKFEAVESVLTEFFKENALGDDVSDYEMLERAKDWMFGHEQEMFIDWESEKNRKIYLRDMEKGERWSNYDHQLEKVNVSLEVECEIFKSLVNDILTELNLQEF
ncbi:hypothetical protein SSX86_001358 [Deinandra increscens subsp. villosa]|uniref:DUF4378 domain-containing protein n=1 Tax=Deinandra increscens subsp. villosa TaxID=3103831 RepID=A0AAP0DUN0_9ASTR